MKAVFQIIFTLIFLNCHYAQNISKSIIGTWQLESENYQYNFENNNNYSSISSDNHINGKWRVDELNKTLVLLMDKDSVIFKVSFNGQIQMLWNYGDGNLILNKHIKNVYEYFPESVDFVFDLKVVTKAEIMEGTVEQRNIAKEEINGISYLKTETEFFNINVEKQTSYSRLTDDAILGIYPASVNSYEYTMISFPLFIGKKWTLKHPLLETNYLFDSQTSITINGKEYEDCIKLIGIGKFKSKDITFNDIVYYSRNIGMIKLERVGSNEYKWIFELKEFNSSKNFN